MLLENCPYPRDGRVRQEAIALVSAGYQVSVICPKGPGHPLREIIDGVRVYRFPAPPPAKGLLGYLWEYGYSMAAMFLISLVEFLTDGFDVVHAHCPPDTLALIAAFYKLFGKFFVYDHHDLAPELYYARFGGRGNQMIYRALIWFENLSCRLADLVITTNQSYKSIEMQRGKVPEEQITIVRNGPDLDRMRPVAPDHDLRQKGNSIIVYVGVMGFQDGVDYLLRALKHLLYDLGRTDFFCYLVGDGDALSDLKEMAEKLNLENYVSFTGWVEHIKITRYLSSMDIGVAPEPSNAYNDKSTVIKIMEYMALGKPIVAFELPEHRATAQDAAAYARPNDVLDLAHQIAALMDDPAQRQRMGQIGWDRIESILAWQYQEKLLLQSYQSLWQ
jgi:glycosyltransferase involved in cell wall biosynthesis